MTRPKEGLRFDLHVHSEFSPDCRSPVRGIVERARSIGLSGAAIADHDCVDGALRALSFSDSGFLVIPAVEITTSCGDLLGLFVADQVLSTSGSRTLHELFEGMESVPAESGTRTVYDPESAVRAVLGAGGLPVVAHPQRSEFFESGGLVSGIRGVEVFNGRETALSALEPGEGEPGLVELSRRHNLFRTAGSDAHYVRHVGTVVTEMELDTLSLDAVREALLSNTQTIWGKRTSRTLFYANLILRKLHRVSRKL